MTMECIEKHKQLKEEILSEFTEIRTDVKEILKILNGNGGTGMCAKVNFLWGTFVFLITTVVIQAVILTRMLIS